MLSATKGMYSYLVGEMEIGRALYKKANTYFKLNKIYHGHASSLLHQAMVEKLHDINTAKIILEEAKKEAKKTNRSPELFDKIIRELGLLK